MRSPDADLSPRNRSRALSGNDRFRQLAACDVIVICVPTPLTKHRDPDLSFVEATSRSIAEHLRPGQLIVLESTTYPGTTDEVVKVRSWKSHRPEIGAGFLPRLLAGARGSRQPALRHRDIPKVVAGDGAEALA
jgi:UDP-N-acetyl-D-glucosamine dehydrogenase